MFRSRNIVKILLVMLVLAGTPMMCSATTMTITGTVVEGKGEPVGGVTVGLYSGVDIILLGRTLKSVSTGKDGTFIMSADLSPGYGYTLVATTTGYQSGRESFTVPLLSKITTIGPVTITVARLNAAPTAQANGPYSGTVGEMVAFSSTGSTDSDGTISEYRWNFGDGTGNVLDTNPNHVFSVAGSYTVSLMVTDNDGATDTDTASCDIVSASPVAFVDGPYSGEVDQPISFNSAGSSDPDGTIISYLWDFGDGETSNEPDPTHTYSTEGTYPVTLTVTDDAGFTGMDNTDCTVSLPPNEPPVAEVNGPYEGSEDSTISYNSAGSSDPDGTIISYLWDFGDGETSIEENPSHDYAEPGTYSVSLTVTDDRGGVQTIAATVTVSAKAGFPWLPVLAVLVVAGGAAAYYFLVMQKKTTEKVLKPTSLRLKADETEIPADDRSTLTVTVELLDDEGNPIEAPEDTEITLSSTLGSLNGSVTMPQDQTTVSATLTSGPEFGTFRVTAEAQGLMTGYLNLTFTEKNRYCMHCGAKMSMEDSVCPKCGKTPPSGVNVKQCNNCGEIMPSVAKFCGECGARQPDVEE